jgi:hypothetical protein
MLMLGGAGVIVVGLITWLGQLWLGRTLARERASNETALAALRTRLDGHLAATSAALSTLASAHSEAQQRRLSAIAALWAEIVKMRSAAGAGLTFFGTLAPSEYDRALQTNQTIRTMVSEQRGAGRPIQEGLFPSSPDVEVHRPFLGEQLWDLFATYRQVLGRAMWLLEDGLATGHVVGWFQDQNLLKIIEAALTPHEMAVVTSGTRREFSPVLYFLEQRILSGCEAVLSAKAVGEAAMAQGHELARRANQMEPAEARRALGLDQTAP